MNKLAWAYKDDAERLWLTHRATERDDPQRSKECRALAFEAARAADRLALLSWRPHVSNLKPPGVAGA